MWRIIVKVYIITKQLALQHRYNTMRKILTKNEFHIQYSIRDLRDPSHIVCFEEKIDETNSKEIVLSVSTNPCGKNGFSSDDVVRVYGLVSHGRRAYRTVLFVRHDIMSMWFTSTHTESKSHNISFSRCGRSVSQCGDDVISCHWTWWQDGDTIETAKSNVPSTLFESHRFWFSSQDGSLDIQDKARERISFMLRTMSYSNRKGNVLQTRESRFHIEFHLRHLLRIENVLIF